MALNEGLAGLVAEQVRPVAVEHANSHPRFKYFPEAGEDPYHSFLGVPLVEGGELQAQVRGKIDVAPKTFGTVIAFSSYTLHHVTQVTTGVRKAVVVWVLGPDFH